MWCSNSASLFKKKKKENSFRQWPYWEPKLFLIKCNFVPAVFNVDRKRGLKRLRTLSQRLTSQVHYVLVFETSNSTLLIERLSDCANAFEFKNTVISCVWRCFLEMLLSKVFVSPKPKFWLRQQSSFICFRDVCIYLLNCLVLLTSDPGKLSEIHLLCSWSSVTY